MIPLHASASKRTAALAVIATKRPEKTGASPDTAPKRTTTIVRGRETIEPTSSISSMNTTLHKVSGNANNEPANVPGEAITRAATTYAVVRPAFNVRTVNAKTK